MFSQIDNQKLIFYLFPNFLNISTQNLPDFVIYINQINMDNFQQVPETNFKEEPIPLYVKEIKSIITHEMGMSMQKMRHLEISRIIEQRKISSILDFGCSRAQLLQKLGRSNQLQLIMGVEKDDLSLAYGISNTAPEHIQSTIQFQREKDQQIFIYNGDVTKKYQQLKENNVQFVSMMELIEHLMPQEVPKAVENVFGYLRPQFCFISTPNKDFNHFFNFQEGQMRCWDHKFEWTRKEFLAFCEEIKEKYGYNFEIGGIGQHVSDNSFGQVTQFALFQRLEKISKTELKQYDADDGLQERAHYVNKSWKNNKQEIMKSFLYKSLRQKEEISFNDAIKFIKEQQIGVTMQQHGETVDRRFILAYLQQFMGSFQWNEDGYKIKPYVEKSESSTLCEEFEFDESLFGKQVSPSTESELSRKRIIEKEQTEPSFESITFLA